MLNTVTLKITRRRQRARRHIVACWLLLGCCGYGSLATGNQPGDIGHLALSLAHQPEAKAAFAVDALTELAASLRTELAMARQEAVSLDDDRSLWRWVRSVEGYTAQIQSLANSIDVGTPVSLAVGKDNNLFIRVRGQSIMLSAPRRELQSSLEQMVIDRFCSHHPCAESLQSRATATHAGVAAAQPRWSFGDSGGPLCASDDGIVLQFDSASKLGSKREFCQQLVSELRAIALAVKRQRQRGVRVELDALKIYAIPTLAEHQLDVNSAGDSVQLILPLSYAMPRILLVARPWIRARAEGRRAKLELADAESWWRAW